MKKVMKVAGAFFSFVSALYLVGPMCALAIYEPRAPHEREVE